MQAPLPLAFMLRVEVASQVVCCTDLCSQVFCGLQYYAPKPR